MIRTMSALVVFVMIATVTAAAETPDAPKAPVKERGLVRAIADSFACKKLANLFTAGTIVTTGTKDELAGYLGAAVKEANCFLTQQGDVFFLEKKISNAAYCVLRMKDKDCYWMPGEAFE